MYFFFNILFKDNESMFSFGYNGNGELGIGSRLTKSLPQKIDFENNEKINNVFSSNSCSGAFFYSSLFF
jgi:alpha-tubulin suppressor-like RCC1 family protein